jgi:hypothetical protein
VSRGGLASARTLPLIGRTALTGLALTHGYDTAFWWQRPIRVCHFR